MHYGKFWITLHLMAQAQRKGIEWSRITETLDSHTAYPSRSHPDQRRLVNGDLCLVVSPSNDVITCYVNATVTPLRADQMRKAG